MPTKYTYVILFNYLLIPKMTKQLFNNYFKAYLFYFNVYWLVTGGNLSKILQTGKINIANNAIIFSLFV